MKRLLSILLALVMVLGIMPLSAVPAEAATTLSLAQLKEKFPDGKYYNHYVNNAKESANYQRDYGLEDFADSVTSQPCAKHSGSDYDSFVHKYDCNVFNGGMQCYAFAHRLAYLAYGTRASSWSKKYTASSVKPGDVIHYKGDGASASSGHWVFVTAVSGTTVTVGECNWGGNCIIRWGRSFNLSNATSFTIYSAPYELSNGYEIDNRYPTPFIANTILWNDPSNGKTPVYSAVGSTTVSGYIYNGYNGYDDDCTIQEVYTNGWCKVQVPDLDGVHYCKLSVFVKNTSYSTWYVTAPSYIDAYRRSDHGSPRGWIDENDNVCVISETDTMYQVIYPTPSGYYSRWVDRCTLKHSYNSVVTAPTCTAKGYTTHTCKICGTSYKDTYTDAKGHSYGSWTTTKAATCTVKGTERRDCKNCDHYETREIAAKGHSYKSVVTSPTCTAKGYTTHTCSNCGNSYVDTYVDAKGHSYGNWTQTMVPTCEEKGAERRDCKNCDHYETREIAAKGHDYQSEVTDATCTEQGYTTHTCTNCGDSYVDSYVDAWGHEYGEWYETEAPTCEGQGEERHDCIRCDHYETRKTDPAGHSLTHHEAKAATCTEHGWEAYVTCSKCDYSTYKEIGALGHEYGEWYETEAPTCEGQGEERHDCIRCDHYETRKTDPAGHSLTHHEAKAATCTEHGWEAYDTCSKCDYTTYKEIGALGHEYGEWYETEAPTCEGQGEERHDCVRCDHYETRKTDPAGHSLTHHEAKAPTCTEHGWEAYDTCSKCDYTTYKEVDALGHGYNNGVCKRCGDVLGTVTTGNWTMSLDSVIYLNYYPTLTGFGEDFDFASCGGYILWTGEAAPSSRYVMYPGAENCVDVTGGWYQNEAGDWYVRTHDIYAKNLGDMVYIRPYVIVNGEYVYGACWYYSPAWYCYDILSNMEQDEDTRNVCAALLAYGAAAQIYFDYNTEELVTEIPSKWSNIDLSQYNLEYDESYIDELPTGATIDQHIKDLAATLSGTRVSITHKPDTLDLQGAIRLTVRYSMENVSIDWTNVASAKVLFWNEDAMAALDALSVDNANYIGDLVYDEAEGIYKAQSDHILAKNLGDVVYFSVRIEMNDGTVYRGGLNWYSPEAFVADSIASESGAIEVCKAIAVYSEMARIRFGEKEA